MISCDCSTLVFSQNINSQPMLKVHLSHMIKSILNLLFILVDFSKHVDRINIELYFKGSQLETFKL